MIKFIYFISLLFCCNLAFAQDSIVVPKIDTTLIVNSAPKNIQIDSDSIIKRTFAKDFKSNYRDAAFVYEYKTAEKNAWDRFKEWLASFFKNLFNLSSNSVSMDVIEIILKVLAVCIVIFVIYLIVKAIINKEGQWIIGKNSDKKTIQYSEIEKNIHLIDFKKLIEKSTQDGDKRITIRYYYLWLLKVMAANHYIEWDIEKTNSDYLYEIQNPAHKNTFSYLSYLYNYTWYGEFDIDETTYQNAISSFNKALKTFSNA